MPHHRLRLKLLLIPILLTLLFRPTPAWACSCAMPPLPDQAFTDTSAVFTAEVTGITNLSSLTGVSQIIATVSSWTNTSPPPSYYEDKVSLRLLNSWKGVTTPTVTIATDTSTCGYPFTVGRQYIIYADPSPDGILKTNGCTRTSELPYASADMAFLSAKHQVTIASAPLPLVPIIGAFIFITLALTASLILYHRVMRAKP